MDKYKLEGNVSIITVVTFLSYITYISYQLGNSLYYGYPIEMIGVNFNALILTLTRNAVIIIGVFTLFRSVFRSNNSFIHNAFVITCSTLALVLCYGTQEISLKLSVITLALFLLIFSLNSFAKKVLRDPDKSIFSKWKVLLVINYMLLAFCIGNYTPSLFDVKYIENNSIIISLNGTDALLVSCDSQGKKRIKATTISDKYIRSAPDDILIRNWVTSSCNNLTAIKTNTL